MVTLREELRILDLADIKFEIECIKELREIENRHYYEPSYPSFIDVIKLCDKRLRKLMKQYENNYGVKLYRKEF